MLKKCRLLDSLSIQPSSCSIWLFMLFFSLLLFFKSKIIDVCLSLVRTLSLIFGCKLEIVNYTHFF